MRHSRWTAAALLAAACSQGIPADALDTACGLELLHAELDDRQQILDLHADLDRIVDEHDLKPLYDTWDDDERLAMGIVKLRDITTPDPGPFGAGENPLWFVEPHRAQLADDCDRRP